MKEMTIKQIEDMLFSMDGKVTESKIARLRNDKRKGVQTALNKFIKQKEKEQAQKGKFQFLQKYEQDLRKQGISLIAGIDEVGRGPLAGPVVSAAVILEENIELYGIDDSKKLSESKRNYFYQQIVEQARSIGIGIVSAETIDEINIYQASIQAMKQAINKLDELPEHLLIDAMSLPVNIPQTSIVKGDSKSISIAAASIIAKVTRDRMMKELDQLYPAYGFANHMGYGTKEHLDALGKYGPIKEHRNTFAPVQSVLFDRELG